MTRWLRRHAETITAVCVVISILLGGVLVYIAHMNS